MNINLLYATSGLSVILLIAVIWLGVKLYRLDRIRKHFYSSASKRDLEQVLVDQNRNITQVTRDIIALNEDVNRLGDLNKNNIQKVGLVRFNPFDDAGGNISFALALLNNHNDGVVVSSLHAREGTRIYGKSIESGESKSKLTDEEIQAIKEAK